MNCRKWFLFLLLAPACQGGAAEQDELKAEVIKIHDRIMPRTSELIKARAGLIELSGSMDSLKQARPEADTALLHARADSLVTALDRADNAMSEWMESFRTDYSGMQQEEVVQYLQEERNKIQGVERSYEESIGAARQFLDELKGGN